MRGALAIAAIAALLAAGCGDGGAADDSGEHGAVDTAVATAPAAEPEVITETATAPAPAPPPATVTAPEPTPTSPEAAPGGAGDEEGIQATVRLVLGAGGDVSPATVRAPAFFTTKLVVENRDDAEHTLAVGDVSETLRPRSTTTLTVPGRPSADVPVLVDGARKATLRVTAEATP